jgi:hypothetical protein
LGGGCSPGWPTRRCRQLSNSAALTVQLLAPNQQVLVLGEIAGARKGDGWFSVADIHELLEGLRLPPRHSVARSLGQLRAAHLVRERAGSTPWTLTPLGREQATAVVGALDYNRVEAELVGAPGATYASALHAVIGPEWAPAKWKPGIARLLEQFPFETNVFCMTRFPRGGTDELPDPVSAAIDVLRSAAAAHGLVLHVASDRQIEDDLLGNVGAHMWACNYGVGLLEDRIGTGLNDNVLIEMGSMLMTGRRCALLKDRSVPALPSDLSAQIYKSVDFDDENAVAGAVHRWLAVDLALGQCGGEVCSAPAVA